MAAVHPVGLDIGSTSIRAVEAARGKDGPAITNFGQMPLPPGAVSGGVILDSKLVTAALRQLWHASKFRGRDVVLGVTNPQVVVREMSVSNVPAREMRSSLPFQVREVLPLPVERSLLDFYPLEEPGDAEKVRGLLIAAPKDPVVLAVRAVEDAGLHVARVDLGSFAMLRAVSRLDDQVEAIVDIGAQNTSVVVHANGEPLIVRTIPRGGAEITELIASRLGATANEAEALKCRVGLNPDEGPETAEVIREAVKPIIREIGSSFAYLSTGGRQSRVARLVLCGGGAQLPGLAEALTSALGVPASVANPTMRFREGRRGTRGGRAHFRCSEAISIGLTLGAAR
jgi:type IV pilus assembly protein PilM